MSLKKQARILTRAQAAAVESYLLTTRQPERNRLIFLLSTRAGLRAKEIAKLRWEMLTNAYGALATEITLYDEASKGISGRTIPMSRELRDAAETWMTVCSSKAPRSSVISTERSVSTSAQMIVNLFRAWYARLGLAGCSSHSGRRTFITNAARRISTVGGSLRDVQALAGHSALSTTQRYIEINPAAKRKIVELVNG